MVSKRFPWNAKYETVYRWPASFVVIYTITDLKSWHPRELLREVKGVKENLLHVKQDFDKKIIELLQEVSDIKAGKNAGELVQQVKDVKENLIHLQQNFGDKLM